MDDYTSIYLNSAFAGADFMGFLSLMFLFMGRMLPIISLAPFFGSRVLPHPVKVVFSISLFFIFLPQLFNSLQKPLFFNFTLVLYLIKEMTVGIFLGFLVSMPFMIVQNVGLILDHQRGGASLMINDPTLQNQSSPLGTFYNLVLIYIFFLIDGPWLVLDSVSKSYEIIPPDQFLNSEFFSKESPMWKAMVMILNRVMVITTQLGAPALIAMLMTDVFLGIANRLAPQVQITFLGMSLKSLIGLAVIFLGWKLFVNQLVTESYNWINSMNETIKTMNAVYFGPS